MLAIDPFLKYLAQTAGPADSPTSYMDDIGAVLQGGIRTLRKLLAVFVVAEHTAGLVLKPSKLKILPVFPEYEGKVSRALHPKLSIIQGASVVDKLEYLGVWLGRNTCECSYQKYFKKFFQAVDFVKSLQCGTNTSLCLFQMLCTSVVAWPASMHAPLPCHIRMYNLGLQRVTSLPWQTCPSTVLTNLRELGIGVTVQNLPTLSIAARTRVALKTSKVFARFKQELEVELPVLFLSHPHLYPAHVSDYANCSVWGSLYSAQMSTSHITSQANFKIQSCQHVIYKHMHAMFQSAFYAFFIKRAKRYDITIDDITARNMCKALSEVAKKCPPRLVWIYLKTILNGWATSKRLQSEVQVCPFCNCAASDTVQHFCECEVLCNLASQFLEIDGCALAFPALWGTHGIHAYDAQPIELRLSIHRHLYACYSMYNAHRHNHTHKLSVSNIPRTYIRYLQRCKLNADVLHA